VTVITTRIAQELGVREGQVTAAIELLDGGATVPFIARYRKEATGTLDDAQLRTLDERLRYLGELEERRAVILPEPSHWRYRLLAFADADPGVRPPGIDPRWHPVRLARHGLPPVRVNRSACRPVNSAPGAIHFVFARYLRVRTRTAVPGLMGANGRPPLPRS
jgi:hypothetical protein